MALPECAFSSLANSRKGFGQQVVERLAVGIALLEGLGLCPKLGIGQPDEVFLDGIDLTRQSFQSPDTPIVLRRILSGASPTRVQKT